MVDEVDEPKEVDEPEEVGAAEGAELEEEFATLQTEISDIEVGGYDVFDEILLLKDVYYLWILWADFHVYITSPYFPPKFPATIIEPEYDEKTKRYEYVYPIFDYGDRFSASVGEDLIESTRATGKYLSTIEKMMRLMIERAKSVEEEEEGGAGEEGAEIEIRIAFAGHEIGQRKAFKISVTSNENIVVTNFDPGEWGERQLRTMEHLADRGYLPGLTRG